MEIKRDNYLKKLIDRMHNGMIKVITGIRRSGKSYLVFRIFRNYLMETGVDEPHIIAIELDQRKNTPLRLYFTNTQIASQFSPSRQECSQLTLKEIWAVVSSRGCTDASPLIFTSLANVLPHKMTIHITVHITLDIIIIFLNIQHKTRQNYKIL